MFGGRGAKEEEESEDEEGKDEEELAELCSAFIAASSFLFFSQILLRKA